MSRALPRDSDHPSENQSPYSGRWVARLHGKIVGQGGTPQQALQAAQATRHKEIPEIVFIPMHTPLSYPPLLDQIRTAMPSDVPIYLVGGAVRDLLLARPLHDYDFVLPEQALEISRKLANRLGGTYFPLDPERGTARVILSGAAGERIVLDFANYRGPDLESDLRGRDFTLNALAIDLYEPQVLLDPLSGAIDLRQKRLRACSPTSLGDDPVRVLRAIRLAANFDLHIESNTRQQMRAATPALVNISPERLRDELLRIIGGPQPHTAIRALEMIGALPYVFPELSALSGVTQSPPHVKDVWNHTLDTLRILDGILNILSTTPTSQDSGNLMLGVLRMRLGRYREQIRDHLQSEPIPERPLRWLLFLAALYHDVAKPQTRTLEESGRVRFFNHDEMGAEVVARRAEALHLSNTEVQRLATIIRHHMRPALLSHQESGPSKRAIYRFFRDTGEAGVDICLLSLADVWATYGPMLPSERWAAQVETVRSLLEAWWERPHEQISPPALISGDDLIAFLGLQPGPIIGEILEAVREAQAEGEVASQEAALKLAQGFLQEKEK